jgi:hypothetical protein
MTELLNASADIEDAPDDFDPDFEYEPDCDCFRTDVDAYDATFCDVHNPNSRWNRDHRAWAASRNAQAQADAAQPVQARVILTDDDCPF